VFEILDAAPAAVAATSAILVSQQNSPQRNVSRLTGTLAVDDLTVKYGDRTAVDNLSVRFAPGVVTAIAGPSGAGKSSLVAAVLGFVPFDGTVSFDGSALTPEAARQLVAWSGQRPSLMAGTVAENIALGAQTVDETTLREAMRYAAAELIDPWQVLGVNGAGLSGGQAQRVSLARAFYRAIDGGCPVLILDEPSSALDAATEAELILGLTRFAATGVAVVVVSHRTSLLDAADSVIELRPRVAVVS
jgi:ATP-binding cassette subfamily C protein CydD